MAERGASSAVQTEASAAQNKPVHLYEVYLDDETIYMTDASAPIVWNGNTYLAEGYALGFDGIEESSELRVQETSVTLSGCDAAGPVWVSLVLAEEFIDRRLVIRKAFLNDAGGAIVDPIAIFDGRMGRPAISDDPTQGRCEVTVPAASHFADFERVIGRRTNDAIQQLHFSGDKFFEFNSEIPGKQIVWGRR
ncbi:MAG: hypothetical protein U1A72_19240 [Sulfuritalea sp.]|nr:hypothetical protein [Sulfuritalea sp.]